MRQRDIREARKQAHAQDWQALQPANDPEAPDSWDEWFAQQRQPETDESYALDAIAGANSGSEQLNRRD